MNCETNQQHLVPFHFGVITDAERDEVEGHLTECPTCLRSWLELKREIETAPSMPRPSEAARQRLRRAVAREVGRPVRARWRWWERPLAAGIACATVAAAVHAVAVISSQSGSPPHGLASQIDAPGEPR